MKNLYTKLSATALVFFLFVQSISAQQFLFVENFDGDANYPPSNPDWNVQNNSDPEGFGWFLGNPATFNAFNGPDSAYIAANYNSVDSAGTISNWLMTPELDLQNGNIFRFYTRQATHDFADRMQVYLSKAGTGVNTGTTSTSVGTFSTLLLDINPNLTTSGYPNTWTAYTVAVSGITGTVTGRFGFRYFVTDGGSDGSNSNYIGIDSVTYYVPASTVGINTIKYTGAPVSMFPNPVKNELTISGINGKAEIYDILGNLVVSNDFESGKPVNASSLEKGIYIVKVTNDKGEFVKTQKINKD